MEDRCQSALLVHAFDRHDDLRIFLQRFASISRAELIAVVGPREDYDRVSQDNRDRVKFIYQDQFWKSRALQTACQHTQAEIIVLTDIDCRITQEWLDCLIQPIVEEGEDVVTGPSLPIPGSHPFLDYQRAHDLALIAGRGHYVDGIFGRNSALRRSVLEEIGGFSTEARTGDDYWLGTQLLQTGYRICFIDNPIESRYETAPWSYLRQQSRWLRNILYIGGLQKRDRELWSARRTVAISLLLFASFVAGFYWLPLGVPAALVFGWGLWRREQRLFRYAPNWKTALLTPWYQVLDHMARILGFLRYLIPVLRNRW